MLQNLRGYKETDAMAAQPKWFSAGPLRNRKSRKSRSYLKNQQGFTLVEIIVAMSLMVIGLFAVLGMQSVALNAGSHANQLTVATSLAQQVLEDILSWDKSDSRINPTPQADGNFTYYLNPSDATNTYIDVPGAGRFTPTCVRTFGTSANGIPTGIVRVVVTIGYISKGANNSVTITGFKRLV